MQRARAIKIAASALVLLVLAGSVLLWARHKIYRVPIPKRDRLADCTSSRLGFPMTVRYDGPYNLLLGLPQTFTGELSFRGEVQLQRAPDVIVRIPISSDTMTPCNWLEPKHGMEAYILTWSEPKEGARLDELLARGQQYNVQVEFSQPPPKESSLWLSSMGNVGDK